MTKTTSKKPNSSQDDSSKVCSFTFADGRHCQMLRWKGSRQFCLFHARQQQLLLHADFIGKQLPTLSGEFRTATDINHALGKLYDAVARNRVHPRNAAVLAYIAQLLMQTVPQVKSETIRAEGDASWDDTLHRTFDAQYDDEPEADTNSETGSETETASPLEGVVVGESEDSSVQDSSPSGPAPLALRNNLAQGENPR